MIKTQYFNTREEWLTARGSGIGASEVASVLGLNPWETAYQLWARKLGKTPPKEENFAMKAGHLLEDAVANFFADATGATIIKRSAVDFIIYNDDKPFLRVSPDRTFWRDGETHNAANKCILECKTTQLKIDADALPMHWFCQLQMNLGVSGLKRGALAWLTQGREFGYKWVDFDPDFFKWMCDQVTIFWLDNIQKNVEPAATNSDDTLIKFPRHQEGKVIEATESLMDSLRELKAVNEEIKSLAETKAALENAVKMAMDDAEAIAKDGVTLVTWKAPKESMKFNEKKFAKEQPKTWEQYREKVQGSRRFLIK